MTLAMPSQAQIYRWRDEAGTVQYGDRPPAGVAAESVDVDPVTTDNGLEDRQQLRHRLLDVLEDERAERDQAAAAEREQEERRRVNCLRARTELEKVRTAAHLYEETADPLNPRVLTDKEREDYTAQAGREVARWCNP